MTRYELHVERWQSCTLCSYSATRTHVVFARCEEEKGGSLPCDILFVGEAPGESEDSIGDPFVGPAGRKMDEIIERALEGTGLSWALYNMVGCIPKNEDGKTKPCISSIMACKPKIEEFLPIAQPKMIVVAGETAEDRFIFGEPTTPSARKKFIYVNVPVIPILHPAAILRRPIVSQGLDTTKQVVTVTTAIREHLLERA